MASSRRQAKSDRQATEASFAVFFVFFPKTKPSVVPINANVWLVVGYLAERAVDLKRKIYPFFLFQLVVNRPDRPVLKHLDHAGDPANLSFA